MEQHNPSSHIQPEVVLSQPAKAAVTVEVPRSQAPVSAVQGPTVPPLKSKGNKSRKSKRWLKALGLLALMICVSLASVHTYIALTGGNGESRAISKVYQNNLPSVVLITAEFPGKDATSGTGSGVIVQLDNPTTPHPLIVTNAHVVKDATRITVTLHSGLELAAKLEGLDENTDLAVLRIEADDLPTAKFASKQRMQRLLPGETAIVIGNPLGAELAETMTVGVISSTFRGVEVGSSIVEMLQTDASVSPGNSGGPMFDVHGNIIGIITSKVVEEGAEGIGFALPAVLAKKIVTEIAMYGSVVSRPMMGITVQSMDQATVDYYKDTYGEIYQVGVIVKEINQGNNAWKAGLRVGDKILKFEGYDINTVNQVNYLKEKCSIGDTVTMVVERDGKEIELRFQLEGLLSK